MIQAILFDLDDTLYPETGFALGGYRAVAREAAANGGCDYEAAYNLMQNAFRDTGRKSVFPGLLAGFPGLSLTIEDMVRTYREHVPKISLFPGYRELLEELGRNYRLGIITDGLPAVQRGKVRALGIEGLFEKIIYSWDYGEERQKPHLYPFALMLDALGIAPQSALFVGDNPEKDGRGALDAGMGYVMVAHSADGTHADELAAADCKRYGSEGVPGESRDFCNRFIIKNLLQLPGVLADVIIS
jgi:putative hydrolase of the HAD superfamily